MDGAAAVPSPGVAGRGRGRKPGGGTSGRGAGRGSARGGGDTTPGKHAAGSGAGAAGGSGAPGGAPGGAGAGPSSGGALGPTGAGVVKKRARPKPKAVAFGDAAVVAAAAVDGGWDSGTEDAAPEVTTSFRGMFARDLRGLMYGFGDCETPIQETVDVVEDILIEFVRETCCAGLSEAARAGKLDRDRATGSAKLKLDEKDIMFLVRKDPKKFSRIKELIDMQQLIKDARKTMDADDLAAAAEAGGGAEGGGGEGEGEPGEDLQDVPDEDLE